MINDNNNDILFDFTEFVKQWEEKEKELLNSKEYQNADKIEKEEMLYVFDTTKEAAIDDLVKKNNEKIRKIKDALHSLINYCNSRKGDCSNCILCDISKPYDTDTRCLLDTFQCLTNAQIDTQIDSNIKKLQK